MTRRGIFYNLNDSIYQKGLKYPYDTIVFKFSSKNHKEKFEELYLLNREKVNKSLTDRFNFNIDFNLLCDLVLYKKIETRGFYLIVNGGVVTEWQQVILSGEIKTLQN